MPEHELAEVVAAVGNHDEGDGQSISNISAAVILADKSDVHRSRVRNQDFSTFDIHDRVNYAAKKSQLDIDPATRFITLNLEIDTKISQVMEYFEIFLTKGDVPPCGEFWNAVFLDYKRGQVTLTQERSRVWLKKERLRDLFCLFYLPCS